MRFIHIAAAAALVLPALAASPAQAKDKADKYWHLRSECERHLAQAHNRREFYQRRAECERKFAKFDIKQRREATKGWEKAQKKWDKPYKYKG